MCNEAIDSETIPEFVLQGGETRRVCRLNFYLLFIFDHHMPISITTNHDIS